MGPVEAKTAIVASQTSGPVGAPDDAPPIGTATASPVPGIVAARHPHVWVQDGQIAGQEWPGLVIEQGRDPSGTWLAHIVMVVTRGGAARTTVSGGCRRRRYGPCTRNRHRRSRPRPRLLLVGLASPAAGLQ